MTGTTPMPNPKAASDLNRASPPAVPLDQHGAAKPSSDQLLRRDLKTLATFIRIYCCARHTGQSPVDLNLLKINPLFDESLALCPDCSKLLKHALVKRMHCPQNPKPSCKNCPSHCYQPTYREKIREIMRFSGTRMLLSGRVDYLWHLFF